MIIHILQWIIISYVFIGLVFVVSEELFNEYIQSWEDIVGSIFGFILFVFGMIAGLAYITIIGIMLLIYVVAVALYKPVEVFGRLLSRYTG